MGVGRTWGGIDKFQASNANGAKKIAGELHHDIDWEMAWDDATGTAITSELVRQARLEDSEYFRKMKVYTNVPIE